VSEPLEVSEPLDVSEPSDVSLVSPVSAMLSLVSVSCFLLTVSSFVLPVRREHVTHSCHTHTLMPVATICNLKKSHFCLHVTHTDTDTHRNTHTHTHTHTTHTHTQMHTHTRMHNLVLCGGSVEDQRALRLLLLLLSSFLGKKNGVKYKNGVYAKKKT